MPSESIRHIPLGDPRYPPTLGSSPFLEPPQRLFALGDFDLLRHDLLGIFCSVRCPGDLILKTYDLARVLRDSGVPVIGGFHTPLEKEAFDLLVRGDQPVVICPARSLHRMRVPRAWRSSIADKRLLVLSPFEDKYHRITAALADVRNRFVAALARDLLVIYAAPGGKTEALIRQALHAGKRVCALESDANAHLFEWGAQKISRWPVR